MEDVKWNLKSFFPLFIFWHFLLEKSSFTSKSNFLIAATTECVLWCTSLDQFLPKLLKPKADRFPPKPTSQDPGVGHSTSCEYRKDPVCLFCGPPKHTWQVLVGSDRARDFVSVSRSLFPDKNTQATHLSSIN